VLAGLIKSGRSPEILQILGLGSCIGLCFYSKDEKFGAIAHIMLPSIKNARTPDLKGKYADSAVKELLNIFKKKKISKNKILVKMTGGSSMFSNLKSNAFDIANRNIDAVKKHLKEYDLKLTASDVGGNKGRTINFDLDTGEIKIYAAGGKLKKII
jgi:chemotaxis protein CheD